MTVCENLRFFGLVYGIPGLGRRVAQLLREFDLERLRDTKCGLLFLPPSYVFEGMRAVLAGRHFAATSLLIGAALAALDILVASYFFARVFRYALRTGLLARYSAESAA